MSGNVVIKQAVDGKGKILFFYGAKTVFSNFTAAKFTIDGVQFNCTEQYFHYKKAELFGDAEMKGKILSETKPSKQKALGRKVRNFDATKWNKMCRQFMKEGVLAKFQQNQHLKDELLKTNGCLLAEASPRDCKWGIGLGKNNARAIDKSAWRGTNCLGEILMEVRREFSEK